MSRTSLDPLLERDVELAFGAVCLAAATVALIATITVEETRRESHRAARAVIEGSRRAFEEAVSRAHGSIVAVPGPATELEPAPAPASAPPTPSTPELSPERHPIAGSRPGKPEKALRRAKASKSNASAPRPERVPPRLVALGIRERDLSAAGLTAVLSAWRQADEPLQRALEEKLDQGLLSDPFLDRLFKETADAIDARATDPEVSELESEYLTLRTARRPGLDPDARRALRRRILALRTRLSR
ncbi:MAG: hypothetical protein HYV07_08800 [Deltaproteobacteria bacterium]|nr:hypothetical protein [Deltaproteobacteria bacterium]